MPPYTGRLPLLQILLNLTNGSPFPISLRSYSTRLTGLRLSIEGPKDTAAMNAGTEPKLWAIPAFSSVNLSVHLSSDTLEGVANGTLSLLTDFEWLTIPIRYRSIKGEVILVPPRVDFKPGFPGLLSRQERLRMLRILHLSFLRPCHQDDLFSSHTHESNL